MMNFRQIKKNLKTILADEACGRFQVVGHQVQGSDASEFLGDNRRVQVFYSNGNFDRSKSSQQGPHQHEQTFNVWLTVTADGEGNLSVLDDENATAAQKSAALSRFENASERADESMDELLEIVYQILMDGRNIDLGTDGPPYIVANRWIEAFQKNAPQDFGEFVVLTGTATLTCQTEETVTGDLGTQAATNAIDIVNGINGDTVQKTGTLT